MCTVCLFFFQLYVDNINMHGTLLMEFHKEIKKSEKLKITCQEFEVIYLCLLLPPAWYKILRWSFPPKFFILQRGGIPQMDFQQNLVNLLQKFWFFASYWLIWFAWIVVEVSDSWSWCFPFFIHFSFLLPFIFFSSTKFATYL